MAKVNTLTALQAAIKAEHNAESAKQSSMQEMNAALRTTVMALIDHTGASNDFDGAAMVKMYYAPEELAKMTKASMRSRTADWNIAIDAARANPAATRAIWPTAAEAEAADLPNTTRAKFLVGCGVIKRAPATAPADVLKVMHAKASSFKLPKLDAANEGDLVTLIKQCGIALMQKSPAAFEVFADDLIGFQTKFNTGRVEGKYLTSEELSKLAANTAEGPTEMKKVA